MAVLYKSTDSGAPSLTGTAGSLIALLDDVLVNGYGVGAQAAGAGWAKTFSATNRAAYKPSSGTRSSLYVDDNGPDAGSYREARVRGWEIISSITDGPGSDEILGSNPYPTTTQYADGNWVRKSNTLDSTARSWTMVADASRYLLLIESGAIYSAGVTFYDPYWFGDIDSHITSDSYCSMISARYVVNNGAYNYNSFGSLTNNVLSVAGVNKYMARDWEGGVYSILPAFHGDAMLGGASMGESTQITYPGVTNGKLFTGAIRVGEYNPASSVSKVYRGDMPWFRDIFCDVYLTAGLTNGDTFILDGVTYEIYQICGDGAMALQIDSL